MTLSIRFERGAKGCAVAQGFCVSILYDRIAAGLAPSLVALGPRSRGMPLHEIEAANALRLAGIPEDQMRAAVAQIIESRALGNRAPAIVQSIVDAALAHSAAEDVARGGRVAKDASRRREVWR